MNRSVTPCSILLLRASSKARVQQQPYCSARAATQTFLSVACTVAHFFPSPHSSEASSYICADAVDTVLGACESTHDGSSLAPVTSAEFEPVYALHAMTAMCNRRRSSLHWWCNCLSYICIPPCFLDKLVLVCRWHTHPQSTASCRCDFCRAHTSSSFRRTSV